MSFNTYQSIGMVAKELQIFYTEANFIIEQELEINVFFREELEWVLAKGVVRNSEAAICENLIYPLLKEVWKHYVEQLVVWSHQALHYDETLSGVPDYIIAKRSVLGKVVFDSPYLVVVEAKKDNFEAGWGQCLAELMAVQKINQLPEQVVYGIVSNGDYWEFGQLKQSVFTKNIKVYTLQTLDSLMAALNYVFMQVTQL